MRFALLLVLLAVACPVTAQDLYRLKSGDVVSIEVWGEPELTREVRVLPDGSISFPLVGRIDATALGVTELKASLETVLNEYIPAPDVSVSVVEPAGNRVFVVGNVQNPGAYPMPTPLSVMQAIALAGGLTAFADDGGIRVLRGSEGEQTTLQVRFSSIMRGQELQTNYTLIAGDTLMVP